MGTKFNKIVKGVSKMVGAGDLVDYTSSKIAKYHTLRGKPEAKFVEDKTSGKKALVSAVVAGTTLAGGLGFARKMTAKAAPRMKGVIHNGMSDAKVKIQDKAIMKEWANRKKK